MAADQASDVEFIKALAEVLRKNDLTEVEVTREEGDDRELKVRLARQVQMVAAAAPAAPAAAPVAAAAPAAAAAAPAAAPEDPAQHAGAVTSPMVGTVYMAAEPGAPEFIKTGDTVSEGQTLLIVEAMKTMNQIPSPRAGTVKRILVENAQSVEFGAPLVIIE
ncbi:MAG: acetyl-CoA carboxylase biotin carboxyl carrier protein [Pikeienuella sp.]